MTAGGKENQRGQKERKVEKEREILMDTARSFLKVHFVLGSTSASQKFVLSSTVAVFLRIIILISFLQVLPGYVRN